MACPRPPLSCRAPPSRCCSPPVRRPVQALSRERVPMAPACRTPPESAQRQTPSAARELASAYPLHVGGEISNVVGREAFGDGLHDAVGSGRSRRRRIVIQLLDDVSYFLPPQP